MLAELVKETNDQVWRPRWYYVMRNNTSGLKYIGQTVNLHSRKYCGSGKYWIAHCKKHGGFNRNNIKIIDSFFAEKEEEAIHWLTVFEQENPKYFDINNEEWANQVIETTKDSAFFGLSKTQRLIFSKSGGNSTFKKRPELYAKNGKRQGTINAQTGHMQNIQKIGCVLGGKSAGSKNGKLAVSSGQLHRITHLGGKAACEKKHLIKENGKSKAAVEMGKKSGETKKLLAKFCNEFKIENPGTNYKNIDKSAFLEWKLSNAN